MKIQLGKQFQYEGDSKYAINIPGVGLKAFSLDEDDPPFLCIHLTENELKKFMEAIEKELK
jgi:hypothetical protein